MVDVITSALQTLHRDGLSILIVEQTAEVAPGLADYDYLMESGAITASGRPAELGDDERVHAVVCCSPSPISLSVKPVSKQLKIPGIATGTMGAANAEFIRDGGMAVEVNFVSGTLAMGSIQALPKSNPAYNPVKEYSDAWMAAFNATGDEFGRALWDGRKLISLAWKAKKPDLTKVEESRTAICDGIEGVRDYVGIGGTLNMPHGGHSGLGNRDGTILKIKDGKFVLVQ